MVESYYCVKFKYHCNCDSDSKSIYDPHEESNLGLLCQVDFPS